MSMYPIEEELLLYMDEVFVYMMKRRRINEYTCRISLVFLIGAEIVFCYQLSVSFYPLRIPFEEGKLYYGDCTTHK